MLSRLSSKHRRWSLSIAGWLVGPERLVVIVVAIIGGMGAVFAGLPAVFVGLIVLAVLALTMFLLHYSLALWDRWRRGHPAVHADESHGIRVDNSEDVFVEGNDVIGADIGIGQYRSSGGAIRDNRITGASRVSDGDQNINYGQQDVGINKGTVNYNETPISIAAPRLLSENEESNEGYVTSYLTNVIGRPPHLVVTATGSRDITRISICRYKQSGMMHGSRGGVIDHGNGEFVCYTDPGPGAYQVDVITSKPVSGLIIETFSEFKD
jgi:parallel beta-helix repeat protein